MEWMASSPLTQGSAANIICNGSALSNHPVGQSLPGCECKHQLLQQQVGTCYQALNFTLQHGPASNCGFGCPSGYRVYHTGTILQCNDPSYSLDLFSLSVRDPGRACQGPFNMKCIDWLTWQNVWWTIAVSVSAVLQAVTNAMHPWFRILQSRVLPPA